MTTTLTRDILTGYEGRDITTILRHRYGTIGDDDEHCAHFVGHALGIIGQRNCGAMVWRARGRGVITAGGRAVQALPRHGAVGRRPQPASEPAFDDYLGTDGLRSVSRGR